MNQRVMQDETYNQLLFQSGRTKGHLYIIGVTGVDKIHCLEKYE